MVPCRIDYTVPYNSEHNKRKTQNKYVLMKFTHIQHFIIFSPELTKKPLIIFTDDVTNDVLLFSLHNDVTSCWAMSLSKAFAKLIVHSKMKMR